METVNKEKYLLQLKEEISKMIYLGTELIEDSESYFQKQEPDMLEEILKKDAKMNTFEIDIERKGLEVLALFSPEADELRFVIGVLRAVNDLERIGDLCCNIVRAIGRIQPKCCDLFGIENLFQRVKKMYANASEAYLNSNLELAYYVLRQDQVVDDLNGEIFKNSVDQMSKDPDNASICVHYLLISRYLERIGDHATNISESAIFIQQGENVKHRQIEEG